MQVIAAVAVVLALAACGGDDTSELHENQGACDELDIATCKADTRCQQAYVDSGHQARPFAATCMLVKPSPPSTDACPTLMYDACRARNDCSPLYWQDLGPDDGPVGDPYYMQCQAETSL